MPTDNTYRVRSVRCDHTASEEDVYQALAKATAPLERSWKRLAAARRIGIKFNQDWSPDRIVMRHGQRQQLVSDSVVRATIRVIREHTDAELFVTDVGVEGGPRWSREQCTSILPVLTELGVPFIEGTKEPVTWTTVPGGGLLFDRYPVPAASLDRDEFVTVQTMKNHRIAGVTLTLKNLFGLSALPPDGRPRAYYHHFVRLPYVLADLGRIYDPALNILDGIVCQAGEEWGPGDHPIDAGVLLAGDHTIATDAVATHLMGHGPTDDWPTPPFHRDRNAVLVAAEGGYGTVDLDTIDYQTVGDGPAIEAPLGPFFGIQSDPAETIATWLRTACEQALFYRDNRERFVSKYANRYVLLQMGEVKWSDRHGEIRHSRRKLSGNHPEQAMWLKYVDPDEGEHENEHFEVYEKTLERFASQFEVSRGSTVS